MPKTWRREYYDDKRCGNHTSNRDGRVFVCIRPKGHKGEHRRRLNYGASA